MTMSYTIQELAGGSRVQVPVVNIPSEDNDKGIKSPEWMVKIDDLVTSNIEGFNTFTEVVGWYAKASRECSGNVSNMIPMSANLKHSDLVLVIPNGGHTIRLETSMNKGNPLQSVSIVRLGNIKVAKVVLQTIEFNNCTIKSLEQKIDDLVMVLSVTTKTNTVFVFGPDGTPQGQMVSHVDYSKNVAE